MSGHLMRRIHPGEMLREEFLPDYGLDGAAFADRLCISRERGSALLGEDLAIDAELALRLARLFGSSAQFWMNMQRDADLADTRERLRSELMCVRPMSDTGWDASRTSGTEAWREWMSRTSPGERLRIALAEEVDPVGSEDFDAASVACGLPPARLQALASGAERFTQEDDTALCRCLALSPGYWLRAQAACDAAQGIDHAAPELSTEQRICDALCRVEVEEEVRVLYAVESGSRAWGFASLDSDYDVRFLYVHRPEWYLSIRRRRDVIECPIERDLDLSGWDLPKALGLFGKSNPPLLEWLRSPVVYLETGPLAERLRDLARRSASPSACLHHYGHMAEGNFREYLQGEQVRLKKYLYVLRAVLACRWIETHGSPPPVEFDALAAEVLPEPLQGVVEKLLQRKRAGEELVTGQRIPAVSEFLDAEIVRLGEAACARGRTDAPDPEVLDALLRETLRETWAVDVADRVVDPGIASTPVYLDGLPKESR